MRFKLDENLGSRSARLFPEAGHDVETVFQERLSGARDEVIFETCIRESRCLLSLDLDFTVVVRFPPHRTVGIAVLGLPKGVSLSLLEKFVRDLLSMLDTEPITGRLWIVEAGRIRVHERTGRAEMNVRHRPHGGVTTIRVEPADSVTGTYQDLSARRHVRIGESGG